uniref:Uncharacterized protein n=1 Tax=Salix viminalis TaxID=40686 RepID=A0A6N2LGH4_SALVM
MTNYFRNSISVVARKKREELNKFGRKDTLPRKGQSGDFKYFRRSRWAISSTLSLPVVSGRIIGENHGRK